MLRMTLKRPIIATPAAVPITPPTPPVKLVPPTITAAMEESVNGLPAKGSPERIRAANAKPPMEAKTELRT